MGIQNNAIISLIGLIASLLTIFNFLLALPSIFDDIEIGYLVKITEKNFALKLGFILILEFGIGYVLTSLLVQTQKSRSKLKSHSGSLLIVLISAWLTLFNITEILYSNKIVETTFQYLGMLFFILLSLVLQSFMIIIAAAPFSGYLSGKDWDDEKIFWIYILGLLELIFFSVYWIN
ncbi:hypothetical protein [Corallibacter sp.]|uniref:hypothetical protein n=1 Tax=Corallibacter sp. TaxID=2038084 RepID=UPI003AB61264